jgi:hypothetical protein
VSAPDRLRVARRLVIVELPPGARRDRARGAGPTNSKTPGSTVLCVQVWFKLTPTAGIRPSRFGPERTNVFSRRLRLFTASLCLLAPASLLFSAPAIAETSDTVVTSTGSDPVPSDDPLSSVEILIKSEGPDATTNSIPGNGGGLPATITWKDRNNRTVYYRGDVQQKVTQKHGLSSKLVHLSTVDAQDIKNEQGTAWVYRLSLDRVRNGIRIDHTVVRTVVDFRKYNGGPQTKGVVTSYCEGHSGLCPSWANLAYS